MSLRIHILLRALLGLIAAACSWRYLPGGAADPFSATTVALFVVYLSYAVAPFPWKRAMFLEQLGEALSNYKHVSLPCPRQSDPGVACVASEAIFSARYAYKMASSHAQRIESVQIWNFVFLYAFVTVLVLLMNYVNEKVAAPAPVRAMTFLLNTTSSLYFIGSLIGPLQLVRAACFDAARDIQR